MKQNNSQQTTQPAKGNRSGLVTTIVLIVLAVLFVPILIINLTLIVKGSLHDDVPPDIFGVAPLAVASGSMSGDADDCFDEGALIFVDLLEGEEKQSLQEGQVVTYYTGEVFVTHRIISVERAEDGRITALLPRVTPTTRMTASFPWATSWGFAPAALRDLATLLCSCRRPWAFWSLSAFPSSFSSRLT